MGLGRNTQEKKHFSLCCTWEMQSWQKVILQMTRKKILSSHQERHRSLQSVLMLEIVPLYTHSKLVAKE